MENNVASALSNAKIREEILSLRKKNLFTNYHDFLFSWGYFFRREIPFKKSIFKRRNKNVVIDKNGREILITDRDREIIRFLENLGFVVVMERGGSFVYGPVINFRCVDWREK